MRLSGSWQIARVSIAKEYGHAVMQKMPELSQRQHPMFAEHDAQHFAANAAKIQQIIQGS